MNIHHESSADGERAVSLNTTRPNDPSGRMRRGEAPERAGEVLVFVRPGSLGRVDLVELGRVDLVETARSPPQLMTHDEDSYENGYVIDEL